MFFRSAEEKGEPAPITRSYSVGNKLRRPLTALALVGALSAPVVAVGCEGNEEDAHPNGSSPSPSLAHAEERVLLDAPDNRILDGSFLHAAKVLCPQRLIAPKPKADYGLKELDRLEHAVLSDASDILEKHFGEGSDYQKGMER